MQGFVVEAGVITNSSTHLSITPLLLSMFGGSFDSEHESNKVGRNPPFSSKLN